MKQILSLPIRSGGRHFISLTMTSFTLSYTRRFGTTKESSLTTLPMTKLRNMQIINFIYQTTTDCFASLGSARNDVSSGFVRGVKGCGEAAPFHTPSLIFQAVIAMEERLKQSVNTSF
jgi:hypothetical protein